MAMRPSSRGGGFVAGAGRGVAVPGSAARVGTGQRLGTGMQGPVYAGVGMNTAVQVAERPVTQQGMMGMRLKSAGPGRQVQDQSYFVGLVRSKCTELTAEITKIKGEIEQFHTDNNKYQMFERKYEALIKDVRGLEGQLADYNLAMDKSRANTDPSEINHFYMTLKARNDHEAKEVDAVFMERQERDNGTQRVEEQIRALQEEAARKMNSLPPEKRDMYNRLVEENRHLAGAIQARQAELEELNQRIAQQEEELRRDNYRDQYARMEKSMERLLKEKRTLEEEVEAASMDPEQAREKLLRKVKDDNAKIQEADAQLRELQGELGKMRKTVSDLSTDIDERKGEAGDSHKYEVLYQRDQEMSDFIDKFPATKEKELAEQSKTEDIIVALLEHMSKGLERQQNLPSREHHKEMQEDLSFKERAIESSAATAARLKQDLDKRNAELEKINTLDSKISVELTSLNDKIRSMNEEMKEFDNIGQLKVKSEATKRALKEMDEGYLRRREAIRTQVSQLSRTYQRKLAVVSGSDTAKALESLEQKLRHYEQSIFAIREYIETKGKETDYKPVAETCSKIMDDLNARIIRAQAMITPMAATVGAPY